jgi:hypothetical protein
MSEGFREQELKRVAEFEGEMSEMTEWEKLEKDQGTELLAHAYNTVSESEEARVDAAVKAQPEVI